MKRWFRMSPKRIGALVALTHLGITLLSAVAVPDWYGYIAFPTVPLAVGLLEVWDPQWANFPSDYPGRWWASSLLIWGLNFLIYAGIGWGFAEWLRSRRRAARGDSVTDGIDSATGP